MCCVHVPMWWFVAELLALIAQAFERCFWGFGGSFDFSEISSAWTLCRAVWFLNFSSIRTVRSLLIAMYCCCVALYFLGERLKPTLGNLTPYNIVGSLVGSLVVSNVGWVNDFIEQSWKNLRWRRQDVLFQRSASCTIKKHVVPCVWFFSLVLTTSLPALLDYATTLSLDNDFLKSDFSHGPIAIHTHT